MSGSALSVEPVLRFFLSPPPSLSPTHAPSLKNKKLKFKNYNFYFYYLLAKVIIPILKWIILMRGGPNITCVRCKSLVLLLPFCLSSSNEQKETEERFSIQDKRKSTTFLRPIAYSQPNTNISNFQRSFPVSTLTSGHLTGRIRDRRWEFLHAPPLDQLQPAPFTRPGSHEPEMQGQDLWRHVRPQSRAQAFLHPHRAGEQQECARTSGHLSPKTDRQESWCLR